MQTIDRDELNLSGPMLQCLERGETIAVQDRDGTVAYLVPAQPAGERRPFGLAQGEFTVPDDFNEPCPEIERMFYGEDSSA